MDGFLVLVLTFEDERVVVSEVLHIINEYLEVDGDVLLEGVQQFDVGLLESLLGDVDQQSIRLALPDLQQEVHFYPPEDEVEHVHS